MNVEEINAFILSVEQVFNENIKLSIKKDKLNSYVPIDISNYETMIKIKVSSKGIDRMVYYFPKETAKNIACEMYFGLEITDEKLIYSAIVELFYRITTIATKYKNDILINDPPDIEKVSLMGDEKLLYGVTINFVSAFGSFVMCVLDKKK